MASRDEETAPEGERIYTRYGVEMQSARSRATVRGMDDFWIKALGMGARDQQLPDDWSGVGEGLFHNAVTFAGRSGMRPGDGIVLYASGTGVFFAVGEVTSFPYRFEEAGATDWPWRVNVKLAQAREFLHDGVPLNMLNIDGRDVPKTIKRRSHIRLSEREYEAAVSALS